MSQENAELRAALAERDGTTRPSSSARRRVLASLVLLILGTAMLPTAVVTVWTRTQVLDTDRFVQTVAPLADDPAIEDAVAMRITDTVSAQLDVRSLAEDALPDNAGFLAAPIAAGADTLIQRASDEIVRSDAFDQGWVEANRIGHAALVAALTGRSGELLSSTDGRVVLDLAALCSQRQR